MGDWLVGWEVEIMSNTARQLAEGFKVLRRCEEGLTPATLAAFPMITQYLEGRTLQDRAEELRGLAYELGDAVKAMAARNAERAMPVLTPPASSRP